VVPFTKTFTTLAAPNPTVHLLVEPSGAEMAGRERELDLRERELRRREEILAEREARAQVRGETVSALAHEASCAFFVPCCMRGFLSYCQLLWCQRVSKKWNTNVRVALRHLSRMDFVTSYLDGVLPPPASRV
jgi:hypothetical protein